MDEDAYNKMEKNNDTKNVRIMQNLYATISFAYFFWTKNSWINFINPILNPRVDIMLNNLIIVRPTTKRPTSAGPKSLDRPNNNI